MTNDWRKDLSFSDRLNAASKISSAYKSANPRCSTSEASKYAKATEETLRRYGTSLHDYHARYNLAAQELLTSVSAPVEDDGSANEHIELPKTDRSIGRYTNAQHFKDGLFSEVFKATLPNANGKDASATVVALKITTPSMMRPPHDAEREARVLTAAKGDQIIPLLETFIQAGGRFVLTFPYMPYDLDVLLHRQQLSNHSRRAILKDVFYGLAHLHKLGIIHRDVKPSNILLSFPTGPAFIADLGIAWSASDAASEPSHEKILDVGTTCYRPPELLFGNSAYGTTLDLWAAGCLAAQVVCLNGRTLFDAGDLGSELALIKSMFETLGTPDLDVWPEAASFPDWGKMNFRLYPGRSWSSILPDAEPDAVDLVSGLVVFESGRRLSADEALRHPYLQT